MGRSGPKNRNGFTLIELVVVLVILVVLAGVTAPVAMEMLGGAARLRQDARRIAALCKTARTLAMKEKKPRDVIFRNRSSTDYDNPAATVVLRGDLPWEMRHAPHEIELPEDVRLAARQPEPFRAGEREDEAASPFLLESGSETADEPPPSYRLRFNRMGVSAGARIELRRGSFGLVLKLDPLTGRMTVDEMETSP